MLSVVIPVRGGADLLREQLSALVSQMTSEEFEVLVADNSPAGETDVSEAVEGFAKWPFVRRVAAAEKAGAAYARNVGAASAQGDKVAFVDADDVAGDGWVAAIAAALDAHPVVASRFEFERLNPPDLRTGRRPVQSTGPIPYRRPPFLSHAGGSGLGVLREAFEAVGGFDESYLALEDTELSWRLQLAGYALSFEEDAVVHVRLRENLSASFWQAYGFGKAHARLQRDYLERGLPRLGPDSTLRSMISLVKHSPALLDSTRRGKYVRALGHRIGRCVGSMRYGVWAG